MKTAWDYTDLADAYLKRPDYSEEAIDRMLSAAGAGKGAKVCDVGAGVAHLTLMLAAKGCEVTAVEPNDAMRSNGIKRTARLPNVVWKEGSGEDTRQPSGAFDMVTFGSSFNVTDRPKALLETKRLLRKGGWFACMWNHRDLEDPVQNGIEAIISAAVPGYSYGSRREDQVEVINTSGLFEEVRMIEGQVTHQQSLEDCVIAWRSHATLQRQAGESFSAVVDKIEAFLRRKAPEGLTIPYMTRIWMARLRP